MEENKVIYENDNFVVIEVVGSPINEPPRTQLKRGSFLEEYTLEEVLCGISVIADHPKWWHLYTHSKKRRVRNKYENLMARELARRMCSEGLKL